MTIAHKWKKLATTLSNMLVHRRCKECGLQHRRMRYGGMAARRGYTRDEYRWKAGEKWANKFDVPPCTAVRVCVACDGRGTVPAESDTDTPTADELASARESYGSDIIEIDDDARASRNEEGGVWVQAWVFLDPPEAA